MTGPGPHVAFDDEAAATVRGCIESGEWWLVVFAGCEPLEVVQGATWPRGHFRAFLRSELGVPIGLLGVPKDRLSCKGLFAHLDMGPCDPNRDVVILAPVDLISHVSMCVAELAEGRMP